MPALATANDLVNRHDARTIGDLVADNGTRVAEAELGSNPKVSAALLEATGRLRAAMKRAQRYSADQITAFFADAARDDGQEFVKGILCTIAWGILWGRRKYLDGEAAKDAIKGMKETLDDIQNGVIVFDVVEAQQSGTPQVRTIPRSEIKSDWRLVVDQGRGRNLPRRRSYRDR